MLQLNSERLWLFCVYSQWCWSEAVEWPRQSGDSRQVSTGAVVGRSDNRRRLDNSAVCSDVSHNSHYSVSLSLCPFYWLFFQANIGWPVL